MVTRRLPASLALLLAAFVPAGVSRADLRFERTTGDLGTIRGGVLLGEEFAFTNVGDQAAELVEVRGSCGCVVPKAGRKSFAPGERGRIPVEVNTLGQAAGPQRWQVHVRYRSGGEEKTAVLQLLARLVTEVTVQPAVLKLYVRGPLEQTVRLIDLRPSPLTVVGVRSSSPHLSVSPGPAGRDEQGRRVVPLHLRVAEDLPEGRHDESVEVYTDDPAYRQLRVPVTVTRQATRQVTATPGEVAFAVGPGQPAVSRLVLVRHAGDQPLRVREVTADDPSVRCRWAAGPGPAVTLRVTVDTAALPAEGLRTAVHVHLTAPEPTAVTIPVNVRRE